MNNRTGTISRQTSETQIELSINLDGSGLHQISTGVGFLDHMLTAFAIHGLFDLNVTAKGDLHIDAHHTIEDVGLVLGQALDQALGNRQSIRRMANAYVPMDEALARVVVDLSGRAYTVFEAEWITPQIGQFPTSLVGHFFESVAIKGQFNLHAHILYGGDDHHKAEALFKALAKALCEAVAIDPRRLSVPSTKGTLT